MKHNSSENIRAWILRIFFTITSFAIITLALTSFINDDETWMLVQSNIAAMALIVVALSLVMANPIISSPDAEYASRAVARHVRRVERALPSANLDCIKPPDDIRLNALRSSTLAAWDRYLSAFDAYQRDNKLVSELECTIECLRSELKYYKKSLGSDLE